jgi:hypothetical protein
MLKTLWDALRALFSRPDLTAEEHEELTTY